MVDIVLIVLLIFGCFIGLRRGFILQAFHLIGFIAAFILAALYYEKLAPKLAEWISYPEVDSDSVWADILGALPMESAFYNVIAFAIIFFAAKILLHIIASMLDFVAELPILRLFNKWLGALLGFVEIYLVLFIVLYILTLTPIDSVQTWMSDSSVASFMVNHTPLLSEKIKTLLLTSIGKLLDI